MSDDSSSVPLRQLGWYLTDWRSRAGLTQARAAELLDMSASSLQRLEKGHNSRPNSHIIQAAGELYGAPEDLIAAFIGLAKQGNKKNWWHQYGDLIPGTFDVYVGLEAAATKIHSYQPDLVPGLLQTAAYDYALVRHIWPSAGKEEWDRRVEIKMQRQKIITRKIRPATLDVVIGEAALRRVAGDRSVMAAQIRHLIKMSTRDNVTIRVLPFSAGYPDGKSMPPFVLLEYGTTPLGEEAEPPIVYLEGAVGDMYLQNEEDVRIYHRAYDSIKQAALDEAPSRDLLRQIAWEYERRER